MMEFEIIWKQEEKKFFKCTSTVFMRAKVINPELHITIKIERINEIY
jgi:hypothetical protein